MNNKEFLILAIIKNINKEILFILFSKKNINIKKNNKLD
jgi:hypothetical protein